MKGQERPLLEIFFLLPRICALTMYHNLQFYLLPFTCFEPMTERLLHVRFLDLKTCNCCSDLHSQDVPYEPVFGRKRDYGVVPDFGWI